MHRIEAELVIPGHGGPIRDGVVVLDGSRIGYAGPAGTAPPTPGAPATRVATVMPGTWEGHGHSATAGVTRRAVGPGAGDGRGPAHGRGPATGGDPLRA